MPRKSKQLSEKELHSNAPWKGYINLHLNKQDVERLKVMIDDLEAGACLHEMVNKYYKIGFSYDFKRGYRVTATGCLGSKNAGQAVTGYSGSSVENALFACYYRLAMMLEYNEYQEVQLEMDFG